jgi:hypothetical protein
MQTTCLRSLLTTLLLTLAASSGEAQIHYVARMNTDQIRALDRNKTVIVLPGGILEQHGPYLPSFADGFGNEWTSGRLAEAIVAKPGWQVRGVNYFCRLTTTISAGEGRANEFAGDRSGTR